MFRLLFDVATIFDIVTRQFVRMNKAFNQKPNQTSLLFFNEKKFLTAVLML